MRNMIVISWPIVEIELGNHIALANEAIKRGLVTNDRGTGGGLVCFGGDIRLQFKSTQAAKKFLKESGH